MRREARPPVFPTKQHKPCMATFHVTILNTKRETHVRIMQDASLQARYAMLLGLRYMVL